jgi:hypothetical protein
MDLPVEACSQCGAALVQDAKFCPQCGLNLAQSAASSRQALNDRSQFLGSNHLLFRQTAGEALLEASFTDATAQQLADVVRTLVNGRILRPATMKSAAASEVDEVVQPIEATAEVQAGIEAPAPSSRVSALSEAFGGIEAIFSMQNGVPQLDRPVLKASGTTDYAQRLIRLFLHYMHQHNGMAEVPKRDVTKFLNGVGINGGTYRPIISKDASINKSKSTFRLNTAGQQQVKKYLEEIEDGELADGWYPGRDLRAPAARKKRASRRELGNSDAEVEKPHNWDDDMLHLQNLVKSRHEEVSKWPTGSQALLGLYAMRKVYGDELEASYQRVSKFLDTAFELQVPEDKLRKALERAMRSQNNLVNRGPGGGYKVNVAGMRAIEARLYPDQSKVANQPELVSVDASVGPNGAARA